jgi:DNA-binding transcriptional ArsR family regulator
MVEDVPTEAVNYEWSREQLELCGEQLKAIADPTRVKILYALCHGEVKSPNQMATGAGMPLGRLSYHVRLMLAKGIIVQDRWETVRGAVEHFYRLTDVGLEWAYCLGMIPPTGEDL